MAQDKKPQMHGYEFNLHNPLDRELYFTAKNKSKEEFTAELDRQVREAEMMMAKRKEPPKKIPPTVLEAAMQWAYQTMKARNTLNDYL